MTSQDGEPDDGFETRPELQHEEVEAPPPMGPAPSRVPLLLGAIVLLVLLVVLIYVFAK
jgi:hypothetical protein